MTDLFTTIVNMSITASYVAFAVIVIRMLLKKVPKFFSYVLWLPVLIRLIFPFSFNSNLSFLGFLKPTIQTGTGVMEYVPNNMGFMENPVVDGGINSINDIANTSFPAATPMASVHPMEILVEFASIIWVIGIVALLVYSIISYLKLINTVKTATLVKDNIFETDRITTPFVCGFVKPKVYIPSIVNDNELSYILAHEQTHIKRLDYLVKPLAFLALILHWFNPLMWLSFALMSKDMEMSCDERVVQELGNDIRGNYANSLLSLSIRRSGLLTGMPLAFGESHIKSRIKNIVTYKKTQFWVIAVAIVVTTVLMISFTSNPNNDQLPRPITPPEYDAEILIANKTPYVGNNSKVVALIDAMPLPAGIIRDIVELKTATPPYGITIHLMMKDPSNVTSKEAISGTAFYPNAILLFSLIDNVDIINYRISDSTGQYDGASYIFTYTREATEQLMDGDVRPYGDTIDTLKVLIERLNNMSFDVMQVSKDGSYALDEYLEAMDGSYFSKSIKELVN